MSSRSRSRSRSGPRPKPTPDVTDDHADEPTTDGPATQEPTTEAPPDSDSADTAPSLVPDSSLILQTGDLGKNYGDGLGLVSLDLEIGPGELVMLVGPNGAGKSTFLGLTSGLVEPSTGSALVAGFPIGSLEARAATSFLPDAPVLYDDLSVNEHIEYIARLHHTEDWEEYGDELLEMFNLEHRADDLPATFSRGLKQKTALILGLIRPFSLLLVDEPFVGLDTPGQETLVEVLGDIVEQGASIVCSTHQLDLVPIATRCVGLRDGELSYDGPASTEKIRHLVGE